jgi:hypothetical protein
MDRDPRIARRRRQIVVAGQGLDDPDTGALFQKMRCKTMPQRMDADLLGDACRRIGRPACRVEHGDVNGGARIAAGEQEPLRPRELPVGAQDAKQLRRKHHLVWRLAITYYFCGLALIGNCET